MVPNGFRSSKKPKKKSIKYHEMSKNYSSSEHDEAKK
jgi:hypothetical protein